MTELEIALTRRSRILEAMVEAAERGLKRISKDANDGYSARRDDLEDIADDTLNIMGAMKENL